MTIKLEFLEPARKKVEAALAPYTKRITGIWTNTKWFRTMAKKVTCH